MIEYSSFWFMILRATGVIFLTLAIVLGLKIAYSDSEDPAGWCMRHEYPYNILCIQFEQERLQIEINKNLNEILNMTENFPKQ